MKEIDLYITIYYYTEGSDIKIRNLSNPFFKIGNQITAILKNLAFERSYNFWNPPLYLLSVKKEQ